MVPCKASIDHTPLESFALCFRTTGESSAQRCNENRLDVSRTTGISPSTASQLLRSFLLKLSVVESMLQPIPAGLDVTFYVMCLLNRDLDDIDQYRLHGDDRLNLTWVVPDANIEHAFDDALIVPLKSLHTEFMQIQLYVQERSMK